MLEVASIVRVDHTSFNILICEVSVKVVNESRDVSTGEGRRVRKCRLDRRVDRRRRLVLW